MIITKWKKTGE